MIYIGNPSLPTCVHATVAHRSELFRSMLVALILVAMAIAPASAGSGPTRLSDGAVSARAGTTADAIAFTVAYRNREGSPADWVRVSVGGDSHAMTQSSGTDWKQQVWFTWSGTLPAGTHAVTFDAMSRDRFDDSLDGGTVTITVPATPPPTPQPTPAPTAPLAPPTPAPTAPPSTPTPAATAKPSPAATPKPTSSATPHATTAPAPTATSRPTAGPTGPSPTTGPTGPSPTNATGTPGTSAGTPSPPYPVPGSSDVPAATAAPSPTASDGMIAGVLPGDAPGDDPTGGTGADPRRPGGDSGRSDVDPVGALATVLTTVGLGRPQLPLGLLFTMTTTTGVVGAAMAFSVFGKRRRDGEQPAPDHVLAAAAASGVDVAAVAPLGSGVFGGAPAPTPMDLELAMPRWRRPSLIEARKADPNRDSTVTARLTFDHGLVGPLDGRERRLIRYSVVRLLDSPDELRGSEIGFLDSGDEVQLLEKRGVYWLVLCPDGREGWIHKMTLGEASGDPALHSSPTATMPIDADSWTMGEEADGDVLAAYLESRRRT